MNKPAAKKIYFALCLTLPLSTYSETNKSSWQNLKDWVLEHKAITFIGASIVTYVIFSSGSSSTPPTTPPQSPRQLEQLTPTGPQRTLRQGISALEDLQSKQLTPSTSLDERLAELKSKLKKQNNQNPEKQNNQNPPRV